MIFAVCACREPVALEGITNEADTYADIDTGTFDWGNGDTGRDSSDPQTDQTDVETSTTTGRDDDSSSESVPSLGSCPRGSQKVMAGSKTPSHGGEEKELIFVEAATDFRCPYCATFAVLADDVWSKHPEFQKYVRFYFLHYPIESLHPDAWDVHAMSVAVHNQDEPAFWRLHDTIYENSANDDPMTVEEIETYITDQLDLDMARFQADRESDETLSFIAWSKTQAKNAGVQGTPSVFVCGQRISWSKIEEEIEKYLSSQ